MSKASKKYWKRHLCAVRFIDDVLQVKWPELFPKKPDSKVPLSIGFTSELLAQRRQLKTIGKVIRKAMQLWCRGWRYYKVCSEPGAERYNLAGEVCGYVSAENAEYARNKLAAWEEKTKTVFQSKAKQEKMVKVRNRVIFIFSNPRKIKGFLGNKKDFTPTNANQ